MKIIVNCNTDKYYIQRSTIQGCFTVFITLMSKSPYLPHLIHHMPLQPHCSHNLTLSSLTAKHQNKTIHRTWTHYENMKTVSILTNITTSTSLTYYNIDTSYELPNYTMNMHNWQPTHYNLTESNNIMTPKCNQTTYTQSHFY